MKTEQTTAFLICCGIMIIAVVDTLEFVSRIIQRYRTSNFSLLQDELD